MTYKFEIVNNSLVITNTDTNEIVLDQSRCNIYYNVKYLQEDEPRIVLHDVQNPYKDIINTDIRLSQAVDATLTPFTVNSFTNFARINLANCSTASAVAPEVEAQLTGPWDNVDGTPATQSSTDINYNGGNVGIGLPVSTAPTAKLDVRATVGGQSILKLTTFSGSNFLDANDQGQLAIGTTSHSATVDIKGVGSTVASKSLNIQNSLGITKFSIDDAGGIYSNGINTSFYSNYDLGDKYPFLFSHQGYGSATPDGTTINIGFRGRQILGTNSYDYFTYKVYENSVDTNVITGFEFYTHQDQLSPVASQLAMSIRGGSVGIGTNSPDNSSIFHVVSTTKGTIPFPLMTQAERTAIATPATGLHVYQTDGTEGVYVNKSTGWVLAY